MKNGKGLIKISIIGIRILYYYGIFQFEGEYKDGKRNGKGKEYLYNYLLFEGEYLYDNRNGIGK